VPEGRAGDHPSGVDARNVPLGGRVRNGQTAAEEMASSGLPVFLVCSLSACGGALTLNTPNVSPSVAREPTRVDLDPIETRGVVRGDFAPPGPAAVLTAAMSQELVGRALTGGEAGGYAVRCALDRFLVRSETRLTENVERLALYADLSCEAKRANDGTAVWRGELRGRACEEGTNVLGTNVGVTQRLVNRALSDAAREMASDLALRALGLRAIPSTRVFADESQQQSAAGLDDTPWGAAALEENPSAVDHALRTLDSRDTTLRAGAWNVVAMASSPDDPWLAGEKLALDDEPLVRFVQYKALARHGGEVALAQLRSAADKEGDSLLVELARDALASGGIGVARSKR
jgi:hypothetical protein